VSKSEIYPCISPISYVTVEGVYAPVTLKNRICIFRVLNFAD